MPLDFDRSSPGRLTPRTSVPRLGRWRGVLLGSGMIVALFVVQALVRNRDSGTQEGVLRGPIAIVDTRLRPPPTDDSLTLERQIAVPDSESGAEPIGNLAAADALRLSAEEWAQVRDDTVFRSAEHQPFYRLLAQLASTSPGQLREQSTGRHGFQSLYEHGNNLRGSVLTVAGTVRRVVRIEAAENSAGIHRFAQVWLRSDDSDAGPVVVYCLNLPPGFPLGLDLDERCELEALYFKRWAYSARDGTRTAPLLLAHDLRWLPRRIPSTWSTVAPLGWATIIALLMAVAAIAWVRRSVALGKRRRQRAAR